MANFAIMGFGTVGGGVAEVLRMNREAIEKRLGEPLCLKYILDVRDLSASPYADKVVGDFSVLENDPDLDVVVESIGGAKVALDFTRRALLAGKHVVTSNKELVATHGRELLAIAREKNVNYLFEASVGGGIPLLRPIFQCLAGNEIEEISGILNGTTNFILTRMFQEGVTFDAALREAQERGYAEQDPTADVEGHDACRKICILASIAFGSHFYPKEVPTQGITRISPEDVAYAAQWGGTVKLIGRVRRAPDGRAALEVSPMLVPGDCLLSRVDGVFNAVQVTGDMVGTTLFYGPGAGKLPTASAVVGDVITALTQPAGSRPVPWGPKKEGLLQPWEESAARAMLRVAGLAPDALETFFPGCRLLGAEEGETALITAAATQGELDAALDAARAAGGNILSRVTVLDQ